MVRELYPASEVSNCSWVEKQNWMLDCTLHTLIQHDFPSLDKSLFLGDKLSLIGLIANKRLHMLLPLHLTVISLLPVSICNSRLISLTHTTLQLFPMLLSNTLGLLFNGNHSSLYQIISQAAATMCSLLPNWPLKPSWKVNTMYSSSLFSHSFLWLRRGAKLKAWTSERGTNASQMCQKDGLYNGTDNATDCGTASKQVISNFFWCNQLIDLNNPSGQITPARQDCKYYCSSIRKQLVERSLIQPWIGFGMYDYNWLSCPGIWTLSLKH